MSSSAPALVRVRHFTDPGCPFAFSAEPTRWRLQWLFGDQLEWDHHMVVLSDDPSTYERVGFTPERAAGAFADFAEREGMPLATNVIERMPMTEPACRAVVATRLNAPDREERVLRELRRTRMENKLFDEQPVIDAAAERAGVTASDLNGWLADPRLDAVVAADMDAARNPSAASLQLDHKLANWEGGKRYTCPSYEIEGPEGRIDVPGFNPLSVYETAFANVAPALERRDDPETVEEALAWADEPLATKEVAVLLDTDLVPAREQLQAVANFQPSGSDGYWTLG